MVLYAIVLSQQIGLPLWVSLQSSAVYIYSLALLTIPGRRWSWREMARRRPTRIRVAAHVGVGLLTIAAWYGVNMIYARISIGPQYWDVVFRGSWLFQLLFSVTIYGMVLGITLTAQSWRREQERERREAELALATREAELSTIRAQFQPHFVLNALNSLLALIDQNPALTRTMVVRLADVMKAVFDRIDLPAEALSRELDLVQAYLDVEGIRFGPRLTVTVDVSDAARQIPVPPFVLQPIVENAVKHGIAPFAQPGTIAISARVDDGRLLIEIRDSGKGGRVPSTASTGRGLALTRRRLEALYGREQQFDLTHDAGGTCARIVMPADVEVRRAS